MSNHITTSAGTGTTEDSFLQGDKPDYSRRQAIQFGLTAGLGLLGVNTVSGVQAQEDSDRFQWRFETETVRQPATIVDGVVYAGGDDGNLYALDAAEGTEQWQFDQRDAIRSFPLVVDGSVFIVAADSNREGVYSNQTLHVLDSADGSEEWQAGVSGQPIVAGDSIFLLDQWDLVALAVTDGSEHWRASVEERPTTSPTVSGGHVYVGSESHVYAIDTEDGSEQWRFETGREVGGPPTVANDMVFVGSRDSNVYAINTVDGAEQWRFEVGRFVDSSLTAQNGTVFAAAQATREPAIYALDITNGGERWSAETRGTPVAPTVAGDIVFVGSGDSVYAFAVTDGTEQWTFQADGYIASSPLVADGTVYVGASDGLYALDAGISGSSEGSRALLGTLGHHNNRQISSQSTETPNSNVETDSQTDSGGTTDQEGGTEGSYEGDDSIATSGNNEDSNDEEATDATGPGFGIVSVLAGLGSASYLLKRRFDS